MVRVISLLGMVLLSLVVAVGCGKFGDTSDEGGNEGGGGDAGTAVGSTTTVTEKPFDAAEIKRAGCDEEVEEVKNTGREHVEDEVDYAENPPTSGDHNPQPLDWGVYEDQEPEEKFVHNLEHGHVVVTYKDLSKGDYKKLEKHVKKDPYHIVLLPREANPKKGVYYLGWDARLYCEEPSAAALQMMLNDYRDQGPELFMSDPEKKAEEG